jgi:hypothetical protein
VGGIRVDGVAPHSCVVEWQLHEEASAVGLER